MDRWFYSTVLKNDPMITSLLTARCAQFVDPRSTMLNFRWLNFHWLSHFISSENTFPELFLKIMFITSIDGVIWGYLWWLWVEIHSLHVQCYRFDLGVCLRSTELWSRDPFFFKPQSEINGPWSRLKKNPFSKDVLLIVGWPACRRLLFPLLHSLCRKEQRK